MSGCPRIQYRLAGISGNPPHSCVAWQPTRHPPGLQPSTGKIMKSTFTYVLAAMLLLAASTAHAAQEKVTITGYLPPLKAHSDTPGPNYVLCPKPWVQMTNQTDHKNYYTEAWHCVPRDHSCFKTTPQSRGYGCGGQGVRGWAVPASAPASSLGDLRAEIIQHVVDPCYMDIARRQNLPGITPEQYVEMAKMISPDAIDEVVSALAGMITDEHDAASRKAIYAFGLTNCIKGAKGG